MLNVKHYNRILLLLTCILFLTTTTTGSVSYAVEYNIISGEGFTTACGEGYYTHYSFISYCPHCHHYNCIIRGVKRNDELTCTICGADYSFSGREKVYSNSYYLTPYYPEPEPTISKKETVQKPQTHLERLNNTFQSYRHTTKLF